MFLFNSSGFFWLNRIKSDFWSLLTDSFTKPQLLEGDSCVLTAKTWRLDAGRCQAGATHNMYFYNYGYYNDNNYYSNFCFFSKNFNVIFLTIIIIIIVIFTNYNNNNYCLIAIDIIVVIIFNYSSDFYLIIVIIIIINYHHTFRAWKRTWSVYTISSRNSSSLDAPNKRNTKSYSSVSASSTQ